MSCPYLGENSKGDDFCTMASRRLSPGFASGFCDTLSYSECTYLSSEDSCDEDSY